MGFNGSVRFLLLVIVPLFSSAMETVTLRVFHNHGGETAEKKHVLVSVKITCAEKSISLGSCSLHPASLFKKSRRLPEDEKQEEKTSVCVCALVHRMFSCVSMLVVILIYKTFLNVRFNQCFFSHTCLANLLILLCEI